MADAIMEQDLRSRDPMIVAKIQMLWVLQELLQEMPLEAQQNFVNLTPYQIIDYSLNRK